MDLGNLRHRSPDDAADHLRRDVLHAFMLAQLTAAPFVVAAVVMAEGEATAHGWWGDDGDKEAFGGIGGREDAFLKLISARKAWRETSTQAAECFVTRRPLCRC